MNNLINITNENGKKAVSAKELYLGLGLNKTQWARWYPTNIVENTYFLENIDWVGVRLDVEGNETMDFAISIEFAKHIAMMARTEMSHKYRNYFLECEKQLSLPQNYKQALIALVAAEEEKEKLELEKSTLKTENQLLTGQALTWANKDILNAIIKAYGAVVGFEDGWKDFKKEILYNHGININLRVTNRMNETGKKTKPATLTMIHDEEMAKCISSAVALCNAKGIDISEIINKYKVA